MTTRARGRYVAPAARIVVVKPINPAIAALTESGALIRTPRDMMRVLVALTASEDRRTELTIQPVELAALAKRCARTFDYWLADLRVLMARASKASEGDTAPGVKLRSEIVSHDGKPVAVTLWIEPNRSPDPDVTLALGL